MTDLGQKYYPRDSDNPDFVATGDAGHEQSENSDFSLAIQNLADRLAHASPDQEVPFLDGTRGLLQAMAKLPVASLSQPDRQNLVNSVNQNLDALTRGDADAWLEVTAKIQETKISRSNRIATEIRELKSEIDHKKKEQSQVRLKTFSDFLEKNIPRELQIFYMQVDREVGMPHSQFDAFTVDMSELIVHLPKTPDFPSESSDYTNFNWNEYFSIPEVAAQIRAELTTQSEKHIQDLKAQNARILENVDGGLQLLGQLSDEIDAIENARNRGFDLENTNLQIKSALVFFEEKNVQEYNDLVEIFQTNDLNAQLEQIATLSRLELPDTAKSALTTLQSLVESKQDAIAKYKRDLDQILDAIDAIINSSSPEARVLESILSVENHSASPFIDIKNQLYNLTGTDLEFSQEALAKVKAILEGVSGARIKLDKFTQQWEAVYPQLQAQFVNAYLWEPLIGALQIPRDQ